MELGLRQHARVRRVDNSEGGAGVEEIVVESVGRGVGGGEAAGLGEEGGDDCVGEGEDEERAGGEGEEAGEELGGEGEDEGEAREEPGEEEEEEAEFENAKGFGNGGEEVVSLNGVGLLCFEEKLVH